MFGFSPTNSRYRTIKWIVIAIVIISCMEMKFEEITVTSQPKRPRNPLVVITEKLHVITGSKIQRNCLNITQSVRIKKTKTALPKTCRSLLMKVIKSSATILAPPRNILVSPRYFSAISRTREIFSCSTRRILSR